MDEESEIEEVFEFLDDLKEDGSVNMFGAMPNIMHEFGVERDEARRLLGMWMETYAERHPRSER